MSNSIYKNCVDKLTRCTLHRSTLQQIVFLKAAAAHDWRYILSRNLDLYVITSLGGESLLSMNIMNKSKLTGERERSAYHSVTGRGAQRVIPPNSNLYSVPK